jgi:ferredoxin
MFSPGEVDVRADTWRPPGARPIERLLGRADRVLDRVYSSTYNPLYRTGTLAALCLAVALVTGVYLLLVYEIARPWESVAAIQRDVWLGRWIRALHRYASDAAVAAVALHVLRLLVQGKTWGPRLLAWITGVLLAGLMFLSAITGFVLIWDGFGQKLAVAGARMLRLLPLFPEPPDRAFLGDAPVPAQFFFMNLFLHVAVPLGMVAFLWLHTSRLARAAWFPERRATLAMLGGLVLLSVAWPAPLPPKADLLAVPGRIASDWFYGFWLPLADLSPAVMLTALALFTALLVAVPWLLRPGRATPAAPSHVDPEKCEGCQQCFQDCPFDAIRMLPGLHPERHPLRADVQPDLCVSCGLCAGSCASLAIGPPGRTARDQLALARRLVASTLDPGHRTLLVACRYTEGPPGRLPAGAAPVRFGVDCAGTLHPGTIAYLGRHFAGTQIVTCPPQSCLHREGSTLAAARIVEERAPAVAGQIARLPVHVVQGSAARGPRWPAAVAVSAMLLALVALGSAWPQGVDADHAVLRLGWRLAGQVRERCRDLTAEELAARPVHMRRPRECTSEVLAYDLTAVVDGRVVSQQRVKSPGLRADRPLSVEEDLKVAPGEHAVRVTFAPAEAESGGATLEFEGRLAFAAGRVVLLTHDNGRLVVRE